MKEELSREGEMDKKSLILIALFFFLVFLSVGASYYRFFVVRDYTVHVQAPCDPAAEKCFVYECDDSIGECTGDPASDTTYYKLVDRSAHSMPMCNPADSACGAYVCPESEVGCTVSVCDDVLAESEGVYCSNPETYLLQNPSAEGSGTAAQEATESSEAVE